MMLNTTNINKVNNYFSSKITEHKRHVSHEKYMYMSHTRSTCICLTRDVHVYVSHVTYMYMSHMRSTCICLTRDVHVYVSYEKYMYMSHTRSTCICLTCDVHVYVSYENHRDFLWVLVKVPVAQTNWAARYVPNWWIEGSLSMGVVMLYRVIRKAWS